jgi:hypothetical protein
MRARLQGGSTRGQAHARRGSDRGDEGKGGGEDGGRGWRGGRREGEGGGEDGGSGRCWSGRCSPRRHHRASSDAPALISSAVLAGDSKEVQAAGLPSSLPPSLPFSLPVPGTSALAGRWSVRDSAQHLITVSCRWPPRRSVPM